MKKKLLAAVLALSVVACSVFSLSLLPVWADPAIPNGATISETAAKKQLNPGDIDWVIGSPSTLYPHALGAYYTDYAKPWAKNAQDGGQHDSNTTPEKYIFALAPDMNRQETYYFGGFMGHPVYGVYVNTSPWCNGGMIYKIKPDSYIAVALGIHMSEVSRISPEEFVFATSADGNTWTSAAPQIQMEYDANDPAVRGSRSPIMTVYKATMKMPAGANYLRIILPGAPDGENSSWPAKNYEFDDTFIGTLVVSAHDLSLHKTLSTVPEFRSSTLAPGVYDGLDDDFYYDPYIRGSWRDTDNYNWNTPENYADNYMIEDARGFNITFMGQQIKTYIASRYAWNGTALVYRVQPSAYVATALVIEKIYNPECRNHYDFEVSSDGTNWTKVTPTMTLDSTSNTFWVYKAVTKIPEGKTYYRVTLPGFNRNAANPNQYTWPDRDPECEKGYRIGPSVSSAYDLSAYDTLNKVPDSEFFLDIKGELRAALLRADAVVLSRYENNAARAAFVDAREHAREILAKENATAEEVNLAKEALEDAQSKLVERGEPNDAHIGYNDERRILKPGIYDAVQGSVIKDEAGKTITMTDSINTWRTMYTDYGLAGLISHLENRYLNPARDFHAVGFDYFHMEAFSQLKFMGRPIEGFYVNTVSWAGSNVRYRVYAGSYIASAIMVNLNSQTVAKYPNIQNMYIFQVSPDGENWTDITANITLVDSAENMELYKAVVKIPEGNYFYRIVMPGAEELSPDIGWVPDTPLYNHTYLGAAVASMHDLNHIADYKDVPDACEWYEDAALVSKDTSKLEISDRYFKIKQTGMTVAQALALLDSAKGSAAFYDNGALVTNPDTVLKPGMTVDVLDIKGISMKNARGYELLTVASGSDLLAIAPVADIVVEYGAAKTVDGLKLPRTVKIESGSGEYDAAIDWDVAGCEYDPSLSVTQKFTVTGTVVLPEGVTNGGNLDLKLTVHVTVEGNPDIGLASKDSKKVKVDQENGMVYVLAGMTVKEVREVLEPVGDVTFMISDDYGNEVTDDSVEVKEGFTIDLITEYGPAGSYLVSIMEGTDDPDSGDDGEDIPTTGMSPNPIFASLLAAASGILLVSLRRKNFRHE